MATRRSGRDVVPRRDTARSIPAPGSHGSGNSGASLVEVRPLRSIPRCGSCTLLARLQRRVLPLVSACHAGGTFARARRSRLTASVRSGSRERQASKTTHRDTRRPSRLQWHSRRLRAGSFAQYIERLFGYNHARSEKLRVAEALVSCHVSHARSRSAPELVPARELTRVALPDTESVLPTPRAARFCASSRSSWRAKPRRHPRCASDRATPPARAAVRSGGRHLRDLPRAVATALALRGGPPGRRRPTARFARHVLSGPRDEGRSSYQISLNVCTACGEGARQRQVSSCHRHGGRRDGLLRRAAPR